MKSKLRRPNRALPGACPIWRTKEERMISGTCWLESLSKGRRSTWGARNCMKYLRKCSSWQILLFLIWVVTQASRLFRRILTCYQILRQCAFVELVSQAYQALCSECQVFSRLSWTRTNWQSSWKLTLERANQWIQGTSSCRIWAIWVWIEISWIRFPVSVNSWQASGNYTYTWTDWQMFVNCVGLSSPISR